VSGEEKTAGRGPAAAPAGRPVGGLAFREAIVSERAVALLAEALIEAHGLGDPGAGGTTEYHKNLQEARGGEAALRRLAQRHGLTEEHGVPGEEATERLALKKAIERWEGPDSPKYGLPPDDPLRRALCLLADRPRRGSGGWAQGLPPDVARARRRLLAHPEIDAEGLALRQEYEEACFRAGIDPEPEHGGTAGSPRAAA
jgi:hypothetical protein